MTHRRRVHAAWAVVLTLVMPLVVLLAPSGAGATSPGTNLTGVQTRTAATSFGRVRGQVTDGKGRGMDKVQVIWFAPDGRYLGKRKANRNGLYSVGPLPPGKYLFQFVDRRPGWDVSRFAQRDVHVQVRANRTTQKRIRVRKGASITGVVTARGKRLKAPTVVAANQYGTSFEVKANQHGEFAIGGLPPANYSVFVWDRAARWAGRSTWVPRLRQGASKHVRIKINKRAGSLSVDLYPLADFRRAKIWVTLTNRKTGQWYVARARNGIVNAAGLMSGKYKISVPATGNFIGATGKVGRVRPGKVTFSSFRMSRRGGWITATVVDPAQGHPLTGVQVQAFDRYGTQIGKATSNSAGRVRIGGSYGAMSGISLVLSAPHDWIDCGKERIQYVRTEKRDVSVRVGNETALGSLPLQRASDGGNLAKVC